MYPLVQARNFTPSNRKTVDWVVLHDMEHPEAPKTARNVAAWFAGPGAPQASAHYCVDDSEVVQCVLEADIAWHAPGANANGIGIEHAGYASQSEVDWRDDYSMAMLHLSTILCAQVCHRWSIPPVVVGVTGLLSRNRGITTHNAVSRAFRKSTHTDPGPSFPLQWYVDQVAGFLR